MTEEGGTVPSTASAPVGEELVRLLGAPESVVVVGASSRLESTSGRPLAYLTKYGYAGRISVINPRHAEIAGIPTLPSIGALEQGAAEVAIVNLPAAAVAAAVAELERAGVKAAIVIASGFEGEGSEPRRELLDVLASSRIRLIGPNCVGTFASASAAYLTFSSVLQRIKPRPGSIGMVTQSGALGNSLLLSLLRRGAGVSRWVSTGDELSVGALELVAGMLRSEDVRGVGLFLEGVTDLGWMPEVAEAIRDTGKPVFVMKAARTDLGRLAASGHTGRVVGSSDVSAAFLEQAGITELQDLDRLADALIALDVLGTVPGPAAAVVSVSGASAVVAADRVRMSSTLRLADLAAGQARLREAIDDRVHITNPLDVPVIDETRVFADAVNAIADDPAVDCVVAVESSLAHVEAELVDGLVAGSGGASLVITYLSSDDPLSETAIDRLATASIAVIPTPERAVEALAALSPAASPSSDQAEGDGVGQEAVGGLEAVASLRSADRLPWSRWQIVATADEAAEFARAVGEPIVLKAAGRKLLHRSDVGAVRTGVTVGTLAENFEAVREISTRHGDVVMAQAQAPGGFELLLAAIRDPEFGPVVFLRPGGVLAEMLDKQVVLAAAWSPETQRERLVNSEVGALMDGYRGGIHYDLDAVGLLVRDVLEVMAANEVDFIEMNPVLVHERGLSIVDAIGAGAAVAPAS
jgi:acetate---CoA ligase (ADP-forming)